VASNRGAASVLVAACWVLAGCSRTGLESLETPADDPANLEPLTLDCPVDGDDPRLPKLANGETSELDAAPFVGGPVTGYRWSVVAEDCDSVLPGPTYSLDGATTATAHFTPRRPSPYRMQLSITGRGGQHASCEFSMPVTGRGLHIEACWDTSTSVDLDLYLHTPHNTDPFFLPTANDVVEGLTSTTCNPANCGATLRFSTTRTDFGYADSPLADCSEGPDGAAFAELGRCPNPRSGVDDNQVLSSGTPEIIQVDDPADGDTLRVMLQNFQNAPASPSVFFYCNGERAAGLSAPSQPPRFVAANPGTFGVMWRPADVTAHLASDGTVLCTVTPLTLPGGSGPYVTINDPSY
jgi:hypothetical protein